jgi:trehalose 6-phosphate phosphatase
MHAGGPIPAVARPPQGLRPESCAFFLDLDGTLLELAPHPDAVRVDTPLLDLLRALAQRSGGALALISGRSIATLDTLLQPLQLPASGLHGFERRNAAGVCVRRDPPNPWTLEQARRLLRELVAKEPRLVIEDKGVALALHYRQVPQIETEAVNAVTAIANHVRGGLRVQRGRMVIELAPGAVTKATAIAEFMCEEPFKGRVPVCVGDDCTDEPAFEWVNAAGGISVAVSVSHPTSARTQLGSVGEVRDWLRALLGSSE